MEIDEFEGHYTIESCLRAVLIRHFEETNTCPYAVDMNPEFFHGFVLDIYIRSRDRFMLPISDFRAPFTYNCIVGPIEVRSDPNVSKDHIFELRCKCGTKECLLRELSSE